MFEDVFVCAGLHLLAQFLPVLQPGPRVKLERGHNFHSDLKKKIKKIVDKLELGRKKAVN